MRGVAVFADGSEFGLGDGPHGMVVYKTVTGSGYSSEDE